MNWRPGAGHELLRLRAELLAEIRGFFRQRAVMEVETPLLCRFGVTEPAIESLQVEHGAVLSAPRYLQTSPEYGMKRLLAAGSGPIYQCTRAFRDGEAGSRHNPEFTLLEWYRPGFDHHQLMDEVSELDPFTASEDTLRDLALKSLNCADLNGDRDMWLDLLMSHVIEPRLKSRGLCFVFDYPASQAALSAMAERDGELVGERFELYVDGLELANGYRELTDPRQQRDRFAQDNVRRRERGQPELAADEFLLQAMEEGLPDCSGVALGLDRLLMLASGESDIRRVLTFDWERA
jgi:lysyl-tRNA synthetase class 2